MAQFGRNREAGLWRSCATPASGCSRVIRPVGNGDHWAVDVNGVFTARVEIWRMRISSSGGEPGKHRTEALQSRFEIPADILGEVVGLLDKCPWTVADENDSPAFPLTWPLVKTGRHMAM